MKIVMLEPIGISETELETYAQKLEAAGHQFVAYQDRVEEEEEIIKRARTADIIIITNLPLSAEVIEACEQLKMISVAFTGVDHIDLEACKEQGVTVCNSSGYANQAVAELSYGLMISVMRELISCDRVTRAGGAGELVGNELAGKTLGIIGVGSIGTEVARLGAAFGCELLGYNRSESERTKELGLKYVELDELLAESDIVSLHLPLTEQTRGLIDQEKLALMNSDSILINVARGPIVDSEALAQALETGEIAGAGIDVFEMEPPIPEDHPLLNAPNTVVTPHVAYATEESFQKRARIVFNNIEAWLADEPQNLMI
ncbi:2-hydroxyacid dehydrogenase [Fuchsiella alkaliacetigena]|uniref:2-hydroxyacid dehydrogenase n=1 Tax=Fuchsiella alkaliacetigena TaxID=957042 RepID=UPI00200A13EB|nr:2-hydroxyacid dehydrogenase [Fuchsiella alkaliacetigena]MCK8825375.1 2-hydroxyacid dehydrogenase [Fuchsiella alkaliacetigena]